MKEYPEPKMDDEGKLLGGIGWHEEYKMVTLDLGNSVYLLGPKRAIGIGEALIKAGLEGLRRCP